MVKQLYPEEKVLSYALSYDSELYREIVTKYNRLSSYSKFYYYQNNFYANNDLSTYLYKITDTIQIEKLKIRREKFKKQNKQRDIRILKLLLPAKCLTINNLVNMGLEKFIVTKILKINKVPSVITPSIEQFICRYLDHTEIHRGDREYPIIDKEKNAIGFLMDKDIASLRFYDSSLILVKYDKYREYMKEIDIYVGEIGEIDKKINRHDILDI